MDKANTQALEEDVRTIVLDSSEDDVEEVEASGECRVCGESNAAMHYGSLACVGCKGFFRRALMKADQLECQASGNCPIRKDIRTNCRSCRFRKCLAAGMKPAAVRPNREYSSKQKKKALAMPAESADCMQTMQKDKDDWMKHLTVEMKTMLMNLLNIEARVMKGDTSMDASQLYPLRINTLREIMEQPDLLKGKRSQMRYEPYRLAKNNELSSVAYRRLIAAIDWVEHLSSLVGGLSIEDKMVLVKNCFAPLMVFKFASRTAEVAKDKNVLCLCNFSFVPRDISKAFADSYHLGNGLVDRALDELVVPYRQYGMREEEIVCVSAMLVLNPLARDLSEEAFDKVLELRNRIQDCLFAIVKEVRMSAQASICFGHILLSLPIVTSLANTMCENLQFAQTFSVQGAIPLLTDLFGCFPIEPFVADDVLNTGDSSMTTLNETYEWADKSTQTNDVSTRQIQKRRYPLTNPVEEEDSPSPHPFKLLQPPTNYTLTEMFDDLNQQNTGEFYDAGAGSSHSQPDLANMTYPYQYYPSEPQYPCTSSSAGPQPYYPPLGRTYSNPVNYEAGYNQHQDTQHSWQPPPQPQYPSYTLQPPTTVPYPQHYNPTQYSQPYGQWNTYNNKTS